MPETAWRTAVSWAAVGAAMAVPVVASLQSPLLAWRDPIYIAGGLAGVLGLALLLIQPLLAGRYLPGISARRARSLHRVGGCALLICVFMHIVALWITSPPDVIDVLLLRSPTPFAIWGLLAMWAVIAAGLLALLRRRLRLRPRLWKRIHGGLATLVVLGTVVHALQIEGTMEIITKMLLCALVVLATGKLVFDLKLWRL